MKNLKLVTVAAISSLMLTACQNDNPGLSAPPRQPEKAINWPMAEDSVQVQEKTIDPRVDILFVVDHSASMINHTTNLSRNINQFVRGIAKVKAIDFHIGYTFIHDSSRFGTIVPAKCQNGRINWDEPGSLQPLKGPADKLPKDGRRFVKSTDDYESILTATLSPAQNPSLIQNYQDPDPKHPEICPSGAEQEESFTPLLGAFNAGLEATVNKGFRRPGALFVAILVSDAKDASGHAPEEIYAKLKEYTGEVDPAHPRVRVFAVAIKPGTKIGKQYADQCKPDPAFADGSSVNQYGHTVYEWPAARVIKDDENPLTVLAKLTEDPATKGDQVLSICDPNYGATLAKFGTQIQKDALQDVTINLNSRPQVTADPSKKLTVYVDQTPLTEGAQWDYNPNTVSVNIRAQNIDWDKFMNRKVSVSYTPALDSLKTTKAVTN